jgi:hypothetical protein
MNVNALPTSFGGASASRLGCYSTGRVPGAVEERGNGVRVARHVDHWKVRVAPSKGSASSRPFILGMIR